MELKSYLDRDNTLVFGVAAFLLLSLLVGGLTQVNPLGYSSAPQKTTYDAGVPTADAGSGDYTQSTEADDGRKKITRYSVSLEVPDVQDAQADTRSLVNSYNGFVDSSRYSKNYGESGSMTVRVPEQNASEFIEELESRWKLESSSKDSDDVTDRYTELELELKNRKQELKRLEELMNQTSDVDSLIKIQERMSELRSRIQYLESRLEDLDRRIEYTQVRIEFSEPEPLTAEFDLRESFADAYRGIFSSLNLIIVGAGKLLPFALIVGLVYGLRRWLRR
ncbi:MAG: DUF4349 domain-containing protein [Candidatus Nanohaloarchaea archaeon]